MFELSTQSQSQKIALAKALGYLDGDGCISSPTKTTRTYRIQFSNNDLTLINDFAENFKTATGLSVHICKAKKTKNGINYVAQKGHLSIVSLKNHPRSFETNEEKAAYLGGLFDSDGDVSLQIRGNKKRMSIRLAGKNKTLIHRAKTLLESLGIRNTIRSEKIIGWGGGICFRLYITNQENIRKFASWVTLLAEHKQKRIEYYLKKVRMFSYPQEWKREAIELHKNGWGCRRIAAKLGVSPRRVAMWYRQFGDKIRYKGYPARWGYR